MSLPTDIAVGVHVVDTVIKIPVFGGLFAAVRDLIGCDF